MTFEQKGAYVDLLIFQFNNHHFTEDQAKQVLSICFASVWDMLKNKFKTEGENDEYLYNERLRNEINKRKAFSESRRINALHPKKNKKAYAKHMGNENENENEVIINKKKKVKTSIPEDFCISDRVKKWAAAKNTNHLDKHLEHFISICRAKDYRYVDWDEAFMTAIRNDWAKINNNQNQFKGGMANIADYEEIL